MQPDKNPNKIPIPDVIDRDEDELWKEWNEVNNEWENNFPNTVPQPLVENLFQDTEKMPLIDFDD